MVFCVNLGIGVLIYAALFVLSNNIARFYGQDQLISVTRIFALNIPIQAAGMIHQNRLMKELRLKKLTLIKLTSLVIAGTLGIFLSFKGWAVWAIVYYITSYNFINSIFLCSLSDWTPRLRFDISSLNKYFSYSLRILLAGLLDAFYTNFFTLFIGKVYRERTAGLYSKARLLQNIPVLSASQLIQSVSFPLLSKMQNDVDHFLQVLQKHIKVLSFLLSYIMGIMIITAKPFTVLVLTEKWLPMVPYFQLLCILGWFLPFHNLHASVLNAKGKSGLTLRIEIVKKFSAICGLFLVFRYGIIAIIQVQIAVFFMGLLIHLYYSKLLTGYRVFHQLIDLFLPMVTMAGISVFLLTLDKYVTSDTLLFVSELVIASVLYIVIAQMLRFNEVRFFKELIIEGLQNQSQQYSMEQ